MKEPKFWMINTNEIGRYQSGRETANGVRRTEHGGVDSLDATQYLFLAVWGGWTCKMPLWKMAGTTNKTQGRQGQCGVLRTAWREHVIAGMNNRVGARFHDAWRGYPCNLISTPSTLLPRSSEILCPIIIPDVLLYGVRLPPSHIFIVSIWALGKQGAAQLYRKRKPSPYHSGCSHTLRTPVKPSCPRKGLP